MDDFDRSIVCVLGLPFDVVGMEEAACRILDALSNRSPLFLSTPNLNFLISSLNDLKFKSSVIHSDMSVVDGMPLVWISRLLGFPIVERVAGSSLFEFLQRKEGVNKKNSISVYFFGGPPGVAALAAEKINQLAGNMRCVGYCCPGFGSVEEMSTAATIDEINASGADFLVVALGAKKGQAWIEHNRARLDVPVLSHLGAVVNFVAGTVNRAPLFWQKNGLEWLWRIKEEPALIKRYWQDGLGMLRLLVGRIVPYAIWLRTGFRSGEHTGVLEPVPEAGQTRFLLKGKIGREAVEQWRNQLRMIGSGEGVILDFSQAHSLPPEFFGLLLLLKKKLDAAGTQLSLTGISPSIRRHFYWNGLEYLVGEQ